MDYRTAAWLIAKRHTHGLNKFRLLKLLWLAELRHFERHGTRLTNAGWWRWDHGPFSKDILNGVGGDSSHFQQRSEPSPNGHEMHVIRALGEQPAEPTKEELASIEDILWEYASYSNDELKEEVYADPFFSSTEYSRDFDFSALPEAHALSLTDDELDSILQSPVASR